MNSQPEHSPVEPEFNAAPPSNIGNPAADGGPEDNRSPAVAPAAESQALGHRAVAESVDDWEPDFRVSRNRPGGQQGDDSQLLWGVSTGDARFLLGCCALIAGLLVIHIVRLQWPTRSQLLLQAAPGWEYVIDVNEAGWVEWMQLPEIGETLARRIVDDRQQRGPFQSIDDVQRVSGIGPATMTKIRQHLTTGQSKVDIQP